MSRQRKQTEEKKMWKFSEVNGMFIEMQTVWNGDEEQWKGP